MLNIFICEDNQAQKDRMFKYVSNHVYNNKIPLKNIYTSHDPNEILFYTANEKIPGVYFLDINLNSEIDGIELATRIRKHDPLGAIVFITADEFSQSLLIERMIEPLGYITKTDEGKMESRIYKCIDTAYTKLTYSTARNPKIFNFKTLRDSDKNDRGTLFTVQQDRIIFFETSKENAHEIALQTIDGFYMIRGPLKKIIEKLDNSIFLRCHRSYIVNIKMIVKFDIQNNILEMDNGETIEVAKAKKKELMKLIDRYPISR